MELFLHLVRIIIDYLKIYCDVEITSIGYLINRINNLKKQYMKLFNCEKLLLLDSHSLKQSTVFKQMSPNIILKI